MIEVETLFDLSVNLARLAKDHNVKSIGAVYDPEALALTTATIMTAYNHFEYSVSGFFVREKAKGYGKGGKTTAKIEGKDNIETPLMLISARGRGPKSNRAMKQAKRIIEKELESKL